MQLKTKVLKEDAVPLLVEVAILDIHEIVECVVVQKDQNRAVDLLENAEGEVHSRKVSAVKKRLNLHVGSHLSAMLQHSWGNWAHALNRLK